MSPFTTHSTIKLHPSSDWDGVIIKNSLHFFRRSITCHKLQSAANVKRMSGQERKVQTSTIMKRIDIATIQVQQNIRINVWLTLYDIMIIEGKWMFMSFSDWYDWQCVLIQWLELQLSIEDVTLRKLLLLWNMDKNKDLLKVMRFNGKQLKQQ